MKILHMVAFCLLVVGGLNWLLVGFGADLATWSDASWWATVLKVVYVLVGISALFEVFTHKSNCRHCASSESATPVGSTM